jgi:hypothetical protein
VSRSMDIQVCDLLNLEDIDDAEIAQFAPLMDPFLDGEMAVARAELVSSSSSSCLNEEEQHHPTEEEEEEEEKEHPKEQSSDARIIRRRPTEEEEVEPVQLNPKEQSSDAHIIRQLRPGASLKTMTVCFILTITSQPDQCMDKTRVNTMCAAHGFPRRRVYDVANIMIELGLLDHPSVGTYQWLGQRGLDDTINEIRARMSPSMGPEDICNEGFRQDIGKLSVITRITYHAMVLGYVKVRKKGLPPLNEM